MSGEKKTLISVCCISRHILTFASCFNQLFPTVLLFASVYTPDVVRLFGKTETPAGVQTGRGF
jgi:hypothetical protein